MVGFKYDTTLQLTKQNKKRVGLSFLEVQDHYSINNLSLLCHIQTLL